MDWDAELSRAREVEDKKEAAARVAKEANDAKMLQDRVDAQTQLTDIIFPICERFADSANQKGFFAKVERSTAFVNSGPGAGQSFVNKVQLGFGNGAVGRGSAFLIYEYASGSHIRVTHIGIGVSDANTSLPIKAIDQAAVDTDIKKLMGLGLT